MYDHLYEILYIAYNLYILFYDIVDNNTYLLLTIQNKIIIFINFIIKFDLYFYFLFVINVLILYCI